jgi:hypothetical protein
MIEDLARTAADDLRATTTADVEAGLFEVYAAHRSHRRHTAVATAAAIIVALSVGWLARGTLTGGSALTPQPVGTPSSVVPSRSCSGPVFCLGPSKYRFALTRPVTWQIPYGYDVSTAGDVTDWMVESRAQQRSGGGGPYQYDTVAGVTVLEGVQAAASDGALARSGVAETPRAFVTWLAARPFLTASAVMPTRLDGQPAWRVRVMLRAGSGEGPATCNGDHACFATTYSPDQAITGIRGDMVADYTALRVPGAGTTVVWSWAFGHDRAALARNRVAVSGLHWPRH